MIIRILKNNDMRELAALHKNIFGSTHFSSTFSIKLLIKYFTELSLHHEYKFVAVENEKIVGYLFGGPDPDIPVNRFFKRNFLFIALVLLKNPIFLIEKLHGFFSSLCFKKEDVHKNSISVYLIAVNTQTQNKGIGKELLRTFEANLVKQNIGYYTLAVRTDNIKAIEFYEKNGFTEISRDFKTISFMKKIIL